MKQTKQKLALALVFSALLLTGCSSYGDVETLLRAPQLSGESSALQKALNSYLGGSATLKYPASGDFLSPFAFGDWDGDGEDEATVLYTADTTGSNVCLAVLEPSGEDSWRVSRTVEGLSSEVENFNTANLKNAESQQLVVGYSSAQGDSYCVVYQYDGENITTVISQSYTQLLLADLTGKKDTTDLVLALPENEMGGVTLQLLTNVDGEFRSIQTLALGAGSYNGCAALHAGTGRDDAAYLVMDAWADGNGTVDIPAEIDDGGDLQTPVDKRLVFLLWKDYANNSGGNSLFGVYDSKENFFMALPESMHGSIMIRGNQSSTGWLICNREGTVVYCEMRVVDLDEPESIEYERIATIGSQQLQARMVTSYYGLSMDYIKSNTVLLGTA